MAYAQDGLSATPPASQRPSVTRNDGGGRWTIAPCSTTNARPLQHAMGPRRHKGSKVGRAVRPGRASCPPGQVSPEQGGASAQGCIEKKSEARGRNLSSL